MSISLSHDLPVSSRGSYASSVVVGFLEPGSTLSNAKVILLGSQSRQSFHVLIYGEERQVVYYSMLIQFSPSNGTFEWINQYKYRIPTITAMTVLFRPNQAMFNNVNSTNVVTNTNDEERAIPPGYYAVGEIIAIINTMNDTPFSISTKQRVTGASGSNPHTPSISPMLGIIERSLD